MAHDKMLHGPQARQAEAATGAPVTQEPEQRRQFLRTTLVLGAAAGVGAFLQPRSAAAAREEEEWVNVYETPYMPNSFLFNVPMYDSTILRADLSNSLFAETTFEGAGFEQVNFIKARFNGATLDNAYFKNSSLNEVTLDNCKVHKLVINGVDVTEKLRDMGIEF